MKESVLGLPPFINGTFSTDYDLELIRYLYSVPAPVIISVTFCFTIVYIVLSNYVTDRRSATTVQKNGIVVSNTLLVLCQYPVFVYFFATDDLLEPATIGWCNTYRIMGYVLPAIFHTASLWQIIFYGVQRFQCLQHPFKALTWYAKINRFFKLTILIFVCSLLVHFYKLFDFVNQPANPCDFQYRDAFNSRKYEEFYVWFCAIVVHLVPCVLMSMLTIILVYVNMRMYFQQKKVLINNPENLQRNWKYTLQESQSIGLLILTLCVEWPLTIYIFSDSTVQDISLITPLNSFPICIHFAMIVSYSLYLPMFLIMNHDMRSTFCLIISDIRKTLCPTRRQDENELENLNPNQC